jgi:hypothetical protein
LACMASSLFPLQPLAGILPKKSDERQFATSAS